jgi:signal transduction histidine kinase/CheY-like chemotaxis protein
VNLPTLEPRAAAQRGIASLRSWVTAAGITLIVLIVAADSYEGWQDYRRVVSDNEHIMAALSHALTEQTARLVQEIDVVLIDYAAWRFSADGQAADQALLVSRLNGRIVSLPFVSSAALVGADGDVVASTREDDAGMHLETQDVFAVPARTPGEGLYIDRPAKPRGDGSETFAISRRMTAPDGRFAGVLVARVAFGYLEGFYAGVNVTPDTSIRLARADDVTLVQYPPAGDRISLAGESRQIRITQSVGGYPIRVTVSRSWAGVLQPWIAEERSSAARTLALATLAGVLLLALRWALNHQHQMNQERHRLEQELAAVQRVEALGLLAASVTHDFNNVLTAIVGYAELMRDTVESEPVLSGNLDRLLAATERARLLVRRVLTFDPRRSVSYEPTEVEGIVMEVVQHVRATLPNNIDVKVFGLGGSTSVAGEATEIYQIILNLCTNAIHAMPSGGVLEMRLDVLDVHEHKSLALGQLSPGPWVHLAVIDSGVGLAAEQTGSIFEPFYTTRQSTHGTGIGLTVVRNIILRMKGALDVDSRLGSGTRMNVYWPMTPASLVVPDSDGPESAGAGETVLVVDDERELVALTEELLASLSYEPVGFSDARAALEAFRNDPGRFDAILTDERMLPVRGLDFARLIHESKPHLPIILMTGHRDAELDARAMKAGISEILDKPLRVHVLREALARQLSRTRT